MLPLPDECPECEAKVILNGGVTARILDETCQTIYNHVEAGKQFKNVLHLVEMANKLEDDAFRFQRAVLDAIGFKGPWPHSLDFKN